MATKYTTPSDVFVPEVLGEVINATAFAGRPLMEQGFVTELSGQMWDNGGRTVTFRRFAGSPDPVVKTLPEDGTAVEGTKVAYESYTKTAVGKIISMPLIGTSIEDAAADTDIYDDIVNYVSENVAADVEAALVAEAIAAPSKATQLRYKGPSNAIAVVSYDYVSDALGLWGDKQQSIRAGLIVHPDVYNAMKKLTEVRTLNAFGSNSPLISGQLMEFMGMPVFASANINKKTNGGGTGIFSYENLIVKPGALQYGFRRHVSMVPKTTVGNDVITLDFTWRRVVHKVEANPLGIIIMETL